MSNHWIEHNGGPQPVADDVWVEASPETPWDGPAKDYFWSEPVRYRILNQHLIDAKQAEIDALRDDLETWQSVFPHVMPDRLKSDQQLADEDLAAKIDAARLESIRLGLEAAAKEVEAVRWRWSTWDNHPRLSQWAKSLQSAYKHCELLIRNLNPDTIARDVQTSSRQEKRDDLHIAREAVLDQLTSEAQADNMGYDKETAR